MKNKVRSMWTSQDLEGLDLARDRVIPLRLWRPEGAARGWIVFSVGFGGERNGYAYLAKAWASRGIATAVVEHVGSNLAVLKALPGPSRQERNRQVVAKVGEPAELAARPRDILHVVNLLRKEFEGLPMGLAGHSYGTYSAFAALGLPTVAKVPPLERALEGVSSCLVISPQAPGMLFSKRALGLITIPTLVLTGTKDTRLDGEGSYRERVEVYEHLPVELRQLAILEDVEHMDFAGIGLGLAARLNTISEVTGEWWESTLWGSSPPNERASRLATAGGTTVPGEYR